MDEPKTPEIEVAQQRDALRAHRQSLRLAAITERVVMLETRVMVFLHHGRSE